MSPELETKLVEAYPDFFRGRNEPLTQNLMAFGCECGDGWYDLIATFCRLVKSKLNKPRYIRLKPEFKTEDTEYEKYISPDFKFIQVKEKYATIRLYFDITQPDGENKDKLDESDIDKRFDEIWTTIYAFEYYTDYLSGKTCEECGKPGKIYQGGWWRTLCPEHAKASNRLADEELP
jgi:hypothetical protein